jgi:hypothetical protein
MGNRQEFDRVASQAQQVADEVWLSESESVVETMTALAALCAWMGAECKAEEIMLKLTQDIAILGLWEERRTTLEGINRVIMRIATGANSHQSDGDRDH